MTGHIGRIDADLSVGAAGTNKIKWRNNAKARVLIYSLKTLHDSTR